MIKMNHGIKEKSEWRNKNEDKVKKKKTKTFLNNSFEILYNFWRRKENNKYPKRKRESEKEM